MRTFLLPDLGEGLHEAEIREWYVKVGDAVALDQNMASVETAKAVVDVPSPYHGKILKLYGQPGDIIQTGAPLVDFEVKESMAPPPLNLEKHAPESAAKNDAGTVVGALEVGQSVMQEAPIAVSTKKVKAQPRARVLASQWGIDLSSIVGSGSHGTVTEEDVKRHREQGPAASVPAAATFPEGFTPLRGVRRTMAKGMAESHAHVVPVTLMDDADIQSWPTGTDIMVRVIRAIVKGWKAQPQLNAHFHSSSMSYQLKDTVHLGIAMDSDDGLFVPVIKNAEQQTGDAWRQAVERFKREVKNRTISADDLRNPTIVLSNFGSIAGRYGNPIIVPPTVAILGTGQCRDAVIPIHHKPEIHRLLPLSLTFDHRAVTGGEAARFLATVITDLQLSD